MAIKLLSVLSVLALAVLAGCNDAPPSGTLSTAASGLGVDGDISIDYQPAEYPAGQVPEVGQMLCPPPGLGLPECVPPSSTFAAHFMALPTPIAAGYTLVLVGSAGERSLGSLTMDEGNMWNFNTSLNEDLTGQYDTVELRMDAFVFATASAAEGDQAFALANGLTAVQVDGTYKGKLLTVNVSGLPANATYSGYLYTLDEESGLLSRGNPFPIVNGANEHTAELNIADYAEFHIHVGTSMVNLYKATIA
jgi:hypothetical protein